MSSRVKSQTLREKIKSRDLRLTSHSGGINALHAIPTLGDQQNTSCQRLKKQPFVSNDNHEKLKCPENDATTCTSNPISVSSEQPSPCSTSNLKITLSLPCSNVIPVQMQSTATLNSTSCYVGSFAPYTSTTVSPIVSLLKHCTNSMYSEGTVLTNNNQLCPAPFVLSQAAAVSMSVNYLEQLARSVLNQSLTVNQVATACSPPNNQSSEPLDFVQSSTSHVSSNDEDKSQCRESSIDQTIHNDTTKDSSEVIIQTDRPHKKSKAIKNKISEKLDELTTIRLCAICSDVSSGFHCNAFVCEACKKFFIRSCKADGFRKYSCPKEGHCVIDKFTRTICQYCRYQKCCQSKMTLPGVFAPSLMEKGSLPCRVCGATSSGFHFGAVTCEGCKGFFRRILQGCEKRQYICSKGGNCVLSPANRSNCKACRFVTCLRVGMCREGSRIGRQPNAVKFMRFQEMEKLSANENSFNEDSATSSPHPKSAKSPTKSKIEGSSEISQNHSPSDGSPACKVSRIDSNQSSGSSPEDSVQTPCPNQVNPQRSVSVRISLKSESTASSAEEFKKKYDKLNKPHSAADSISVLALSIVGDEDKAKYINDCVEAASSLWASKDQLSSDWDPDSPPKVHDLWCIMMKHFEIHTVNITNFAKRVPGFDTLHLKDKKTVVKDSLYPIILLCLSRDFNETTKEYNYFDFTPKERALILQMFPSFRKIGQHLCESGQLLQNYKLSHVEMALLSTVALFKKESSILQEPKKIKGLCQNAMDTLIYYEENVSGSLVRSVDLINALSLLSRMNEEHHNIVRELKSLRPELQFPKLYTEVFHL